MTFIELLKGGYELIKSQIPAFDFAYNRALKKWTINRSLRKKWAETLSVRPLFAPTPF